MTGGCCCNGSQAYWGERCVRSSCWEFEATMGSTMDAEGEKAAVEATGRTGISGSGCGLGTFIYSLFWRMGLASTSILSTVSGWPSSASFSIFFSTNRPPTTFPKTVCAPSRWRAVSTQRNHWQVRTAANIGTVSGIVECLFAECRVQKQIPIQDAVHVSWWWYEEVCGVNIE